jgi:hypothetical protein
MPISDDLFMAILSMDAYNRGYGQGLVVSGDQIGNAFLSIIANDPEGVARNASFFAQSYTWNGQTVISYRGTDDLVWDPIYGWLVGGGSYSVAQAELAAQFYQQVARMSVSEIRG